MPFTCNYCGQRYCSDHRLPEKHTCVPREGEEDGVFSSLAPSTLSEKASALSDPGESEKREGTSRSGKVERSTERSSSGLNSWASPGSSSTSDDSPPVETRSKRAEGADPEGSAAASKVVGLLSRPLDVASWILRFGRRAVTNPYILVLLLVVAIGGVAIVGTGIPAIDQPVDSAKKFVADVWENATDDQTPTEAAPGDQTAKTDTGGQAESDDSGPLNRSKIEAEIHHYTNVERQNLGLRSLRFNTELRTIARYHSEQMATQDFFSHTAPDGQTMTNRYQKFNYDCQVQVSGNRYATGGENIAYTYADQDVITEAGATVNHNGNETRIARGIVNGWMNSSGHRENILREYWHSEGIGVAFAQTDGGTRVYATQNFC